jgi:branched-chain amino acid aminotransferase
MIDGRVIGDGLPGPMLKRLQGLYRELVQRDVDGRRNAA